MITATKTKKKYLFYFVFFRSFTTNAQKKKKKENAALILSQRAESKEMTVFLFVYVTNLTPLFYLYMAVAYKDNQL